MEKQTFKIVLNHDGKGQEKCLDLFSKTSQKSKLVTFALLEMIEKYGLENIDEKELKDFIKGYKVLSRLKEHTFSFSEKASERTTRKTVVIAEHTSANKERRCDDVAIEAKTQPQTTKIPKAPQPELNLDDNSEDEIDINPDAFNQMLNIMNAI